jgi:type IX secretion system PorP/SprF family membrane protein
MYKTKYLFIIISIFLLSITARSQQLPVYTQYKLNEAVLNPAAAGAHGYTTFNITAREQWLSFEGAPGTYTLSGQWRLLRRSTRVSSGILGIKRLQKSRTGNVGLGGVIYTDKNGAVSRTGFSFAYSYHISLYQSQLSFGVAITGYQFKIDRDKLTFNDPETGKIDVNEYTKPLFAPDAILGVYYISKGFYAGLSVDQLFESGKKSGETNFTIGGNKSLRDGYNMQRHYSFLGGYKFEAWVDYVIEPSILTKFSFVDKKTFGGFRLQPDLNIKVYYRNDYWGGLAYRISGITKAESHYPGTGDLVVMGGVRYDDFYIAYSFDYNLSNIQSYSFGSHELSLGIRFGSDAGKQNWRYRFGGR